MQNNLPKHGEVWITHDQLRVFWFVCGGGGGGGLLFFFLQFSFCSEQKQSLILQITLCQLKETAGM